ncbi:MAG: hypothetical protein WA862_11145, partial [Solirubrobacterales bacterium]
RRIDSAATASGKPAGDRTGPAAPGRTARRIAAPGKLQRRRRIRRARTGFLAARARRGAGATRGR